MIRIQATAVIQMQAFELVQIQMFALFPTQVSVCTYPGLNNCENSNI